ncbi:MAG TPA: hypothetical protein VJG90_03370 [Candidatus Nanoarchaeia archaeon]|nr:hypothetical protein [Candidatus Nanoarchaeia archaeon]
MASDSERLVKYGFIKHGAQGNYTFDDAKKVFKSASELGKVEGEDANEENSEEQNIALAGHYVKTGYPNPLKRYRLVFESFGQSIEEMYYWFLEHLRQDQAFSHADKITDIFSASENSAFFGSSQQRLGIQQDKAQQFMATIGKMIKDLFALVREMRILDEKLAPRELWGKSDSADVALKGEFTDLVENRGGQLQPGSIFHLSQTVGYTILPDLFFNTKTYTVDDIEKKVDAMQYNQQVKTVLKRKLFAFVNWKLKTDAELDARRKFLLRYLRQHWGVIKMYMAWVKPYLRNVKHLSMSTQQMDSADLINAFETSLTEIEVLFYREPKGSSPVSCVLMTLKLRTRPSLSYSQEYQRGPIHVGRAEMTLRAYGWSKDQIANYKRMRAEEDLELFGFIDENIKGAMDALGEELEKYLKEAGEEIEGKPYVKPTSKQVAFKDAVSESLDPFLSIFKGFKEMFGPLGFSAAASLFSTSGKKGFLPDPGASEKAAGSAEAAIWLAYKNYEKSHGLLSW